MQNETAFNNNIIRGKHNEDRKVIFAVFGKLYYFEYV